MMLISDYRTKHLTLQAGDYAAIVTDEDGVESLRIDGLTIAVEDADAAWQIASALRYLGNQIEAKRIEAERIVLTGDPT